jgi:hypothetical protein
VWERRGGKRLRRRSIKKSRRAGVSRRRSASSCSENANRWLSRCSVQTDITEVSHDFRGRTAVSHRVTVTMVTRNLSHRTATGGAELASAVTPPIRTIPHQRRYNAGAATPTLPTFLGTSRHMGVTAAVPDYLAVLSQVPARCPAEQGAGAGCGDQSLVKGWLAGTANGSPSPYWTWAERRAGRRGCHRAKRGEGSGATLTARRPAPRSFRSRGRAPCAALCGRCATCGRVSYAENDAICWDFWDEAAPQSPPYGEESPFLRDPRREGTAACDCLTTPAFLTETTDGKLSVGHLRSAHSGRGPACVCLVRVLLEARERLLGGREQSNEAAAPSPSGPCCSGPNVRQLGRR